LLKRAGGSVADLPVVVDAADQVFVDGEHIGQLDGFAFHPDASARAGERKLLLAAAERHLAAYLRNKARAVIMAETEEFAIARDTDGRPALLWQGAVLGHLTKGRTLLQPLFKPVRAVAGLEGGDLRAIAEKAEGWIQLQLAKHMGGLLALNQLAADAATDGMVRALAARLADAGGIAGRQFLADTLTALPKEARGAARKAGIVFGALDVYHHAVLKPAAAKWRVALFAAQTENAMSELPPESAVHLKEWNFASTADCRNAGYRQIGDEYVRIDLAERVIKKAHEARGDAPKFAMDMAFATSLGLSENGLLALMRDAGFKRLQRGSEAPSQEVETEADGVTSQDDGVSLTETPPEAAVLLVEPSATSPSDETPVAAPAPQPANLTYWQWIGLRKAASQANHRQSRPVKNQKSGGKKPPNARKVGPSPKIETAAPSALALQLAALKEKMGG
jgi:ATP-dependent RNA helicase SUPV3L1/SUV3